MVHRCAARCAHRHGGSPLSGLRTVRVGLSDRIVSTGVRGSLVGSEPITLVALALRAVQGTLTGALRWSAPTGGHSNSDERFCAARPQTPGTGVSGAATDALSAMLR